MFKTYIPLLRQNTLYVCALCGHSSEDYMDSIKHVHELPKPPRITRRIIDLIEKSDLKNYLEIN